MAKILLVDDDAQLRKSFQNILHTEGYEVVEAHCGETGVELAEKERPDIAVLDVRLPGMNGLETFKALRALYSDLPVLIMTAYGTTDTAIESTKMGAFDYVMKPFDVPEILSLIEKAIQAASVHAHTSPMPSNTPILLGKSRAMQDVCKKIGRAAPTDATILIRGESGTGKELVAQAIHKHSLRSKAPFQVINCVAIPDTLLESELFGYEKGAFTGASHRKAGKIELANGGTVFLDEIGDMPTSIQAKILRLLQERQVERLGGSHPISVDVRVLAATNKDLEQAVSNGEFREDLYYRLNVVNIPLPPIRERTEDIPMLAEHFLSMHSNASDMHNPGLTDEALVMMQKYLWPGNVRELSNKMHKALIFSRGLPLGKDDFVKLVDGAAAPPQTVGDEENVRSWVTRTLLTEHHEKTFETLADRFGAIVISEALELASWNKTRASKLLGMSRPTLLGRIEKYGLKEKGR